MTEVMPAAAPQIKRLTGDRLAPGEGSMNCIVLCGQQCLRAHISILQAMLECSAYPLVEVVAPKLYG